MRADAPLHFRDHVCKLRSNRWCRRARPGGRRFLCMLHVNAFVEDLAETGCDRFHDTEQTIEQWRTEVRVVNEIVRHPVDVPGNAYRIDETENDHGPKRHARKKIKHPEEVGAVNKGSRDWDRVPACVRKDPGVRPGAFDIYELA